MQPALTSLVSYNYSVKVQIKFESLLKQQTKKYQTEGSPRTVKQTQSDHRLSLNCSLTLRGRP